MGGWNLLLRRISNLMRWRAASQRDGQGNAASTLLFNINFIGQVR